MSTLEKYGRAVLWISLCFIVGYVGMSIHPFLVCGAAIALMLLPYVWDRQDKRSRVSPRYYRTTVKPQKQAMVSPHTEKPLPPPTKRQLERLSRQEVLKAAGYDVIEFPYGPGGFLALDQSHTSVGIGSVPTSDEAWDRCWQHYVEHYKKGD